MGKGTEKRQRNCVLKARFNDQEAAAVREMADRAGQSVGSLLRQTLLNIPPSRRAVRRPQVEVQVVAQLLGELGKLRTDISMPGSNINQIARGVNMGRPVERYAGLLEENLLLIQECLRAFLELRLACLQALGHEPTRKSPDPEE